MTSDHVKYFLTIAAVLAIIVGFFYDKIASEVFYTTVGSIITHFYQGKKVKELKDQIDKQNVELQSLKDG